MNNAWMRRTLAGGAIVVAMMGSALAHDYKQGDLSIAHPWTRATAPGQPVAGAYLSITNHGTNADRLVSVESPVSRLAELHSMSVENGVMKMRALPEGIELPPGETVTLEPGGLHIMLVGPNQALKAGTRVPLSLTFAAAGTIAVELAVEKPGAKAPVAAPSHDHHAAGG